MIRGCELHPEGRAGSGLGGSRSEGPGAGPCLAESAPPAPPRSGLGRMTAPPPPDARLQPTQARPHAPARRLVRTPAPPSHVFSASSPGAAWEGGRGKGPGARGLCRLPDRAAFRRAWEPLPLAPAPAPAPAGGRVLPMGGSGAILARVEVEGEPGTRAVLVQGWGPEGERTWLPNVWGHTRITI